MEGSNDMQYRDFGKTGCRVSALGFGCMRLPTIDDKPMGPRIDKEEATRMIRYAIDRGVNYIDTAYGYHGGKSESLLGRILKDGYREKVYVATKCPVWLVKKPNDFDKLLSQQLRRLRTDHIDFYLFHALNGEVWKSNVLKHKLLNKAEAALEDRRIGHIGFSFHDDYKAFKKIIDGFHGWSFCQMQYNYMDIENQAGTKGLKYAASKGLGVIVMEPLLGGRLANPPRVIRTMMKKHDRKLAPYDLALQWIWDQPEVSLVLSGMSTMSQVRGNLRSADRSGLGTFSSSKKKLIQRVRDRYKELVPIPCTKCSYCMPCPHKVDIPGNFEEYNDAFKHNDLRSARVIYTRFMKKESRASACKQCKACEKKCPQKIPISELMPQVHQVLGEGKPFPRQTKR